ncbi:MAG TPA: LamG-like jellyroll fold domain-containing protein [Solimonas sp.]|nr:LamG-like jellyroll fold domain-containing protein [Solimonas sp.]
MRVVCALFLALFLDAAPAATCCAPPTGMVSWFPGDGTAEDVRGVNDATTDSGSIAYAAGKVGQAFSFDGNTRLDTPDIAIGTRWTIDAWINPASTHPGRHSIFGGANNCADWAISLNDGEIGVRAIGCGGVVSSGVTTVPGTWYHVAATYDGATVRIYVNGTERASQAVATYSGDPDFRLGGESCCGNLYTGLLDEVEIHDRALSPGEIQSIYEAGTAGKCSGQLCSTPPPGLASWYRGEGDAVDSQGAADGSLNNGAVTASGRVGQAFDLSGNAHVSVNDAPALRPASLSAALWFNLDTISPGVFHQLIGKTVGAGVCDSYALWIEDSTGTLHGSACDSSDPGSAIILDAGTPAAGSWHHLAFTFDDTSKLAALYLDGVLVDSESHPGFSIAYDAGQLFIGADRDNGVLNGFVDGRIDEAQVFGRALTPTEVKEIFNAGTAGECADCARQPPGLQAWLAGDGNASDVSGNGNNGTLQGAATATVDGIVRQAFGLNDTDADVRVPASPSLDVGTGPGLSIELWVNPTDSADRPYVEWSNGSAYGALLWQFQGAGTLFSNLVDTGGGNHTLSAPGVMVAGQFQHVAVTYDKASGIATLYRNGAVVNRANLGTFTPQTAYDLYLGSHPGSGNFLPGLLDEVKIFNRALSAAEIERIYRAGSRGVCPCLAGAGTLAFTSSRQDVSEGVGSLSVTVRRFGGSNGPVFVDFATSNIRATAPGDYASRTGTLSWAAGETANKSFTVPIANDSTGEVPEDLRITLSGAACALQGLATQTVFIVDDDAGVRLVSSAIDVNENSDTQAVVSVERSAGNLSAALDLGFATANGAALAGSDYSARSGTLHWNAGEGGIRTITVPLINDALAENLEAFQVSLGTPSVGNIVGPSSASVRIAANDPGVQLVSTSQTASEGAGSVQVLVRRVPHDISGALSVDFGTANGNAIAGSDYTGASGTLSWTASETADKQINVSISDDGTPEATENFKVNLGNPVGGSILGTASAMISITDNDSGVQMVTTDVAVSEGAGSVTVLVTRTGGDTSGAATANLATGESSARAGDFTGATGSVSWSAGETGTKSIAIAINDDAIDEPAEVFTVRLTSATGAGIISPTFTRVTIADNDP